MLVNKTCPQCEKSKDVGCFNKSSSRKDGLRAWCKTCENLKNLRWYANNKERMAEVGRIYRGVNSEHRSSVAKSYYDANKQKILEKQRKRLKTLRGYFLDKIKKIRQAKRAIECTLTCEHLIFLYDKQRGLCALTGRRMVLFSSNNCGLDNMSIDRKNNLRGYIDGNVRLVTYQANISRSVGSDGQLRSFCQDILNNHNRKTRK